MRKLNLAIGLGVAVAAIGLVALATPGHAKVKTLNSIDMGRDAGVPLEVGLLNRTDFDALTIAELDFNDTGQVAGMTFTIDDPLIGDAGSAGALPDPDEGKLSDGLIVTYTADHPGLRARMLAVDQIDALALKHAMSIIKPEAMNTPAPSEVGVNGHLESFIGLDSFGRDYVDKGPDGGSVIIDIGGDQVTRVGKDTGHSLGTEQSG